MRIFSEASDRIFQGGRVIATIPITAVAGDVRTTVAHAPVAMPAAATLPAPPPAAPSPPAPSPVVPAKKRRWPLPAASAAAAVVIVGTVVVQLRPPMRSLPETASTKIPPAPAAVDQQPPPAVAVSPVPTIPLPRHDGPPNPVANDSTPLPAEQPRRPKDTRASDLSQARRDLSSRIIIQNGSSHAIHSIYLQRSGESAWAADELGLSVLAPGNRVTLAAAAGVYDLKLLDRDGNVCVVKSVSLAEKQIVTLTDSMVSQCAFK
jgi:hypothetical protein